MLKDILRGQIVFTLCFYKIDNQAQKIVNYNTKSCPRFITHLYMSYVIHSHYYEVGHSVLRKIEERK